MPPAYNGSRLRPAPRPDGENSEMRNGSRYIDQNYSLVGRHEGKGALRVKAREGHKGSHSASRQLRRCKGHNILANILRACFIGLALSAFP